MLRTIKFAKPGRGIQSVCLSFVSWFCFWSWDLMLANLFCSSGKIILSSFILLLLGPLFKVWYGLKSQETNNVSIVAKVQEKTASTVSNCHSLILLKGFLKGQWLCPLIKLIGTGARKPLLVSEEARGFKHLSLHRKPFNLLSLARTPRS